MGKMRLIEITNRQEATKLLSEIGCDSTGIRLMVPKAVYRVIKIQDVPVTEANILKQEMLALGAEAAVNRGVVNHSVEKSDVVLMGTLKHYKLLADKLKMQPFGLPSLAIAIKQLLQNAEGLKPYELKCREKSLTLGERTLIMGILNVTPDSFSDGGRFNRIDVALEHAHRMVDEGADIIDIGAESTRPTATKISAEEEMDRLLPILERLVHELSVPISVDTYKAATAREALKMGAHIINDVWGFQAEPELARVAAEYDVPVVVMHNQDGTNYQDLMGDIISFLRESIAIGEQAGIAPGNIIVDPGIGFGKDTNQNLEVMKRLGELRSLGKPILLGTSRKSMIGNTLRLPVEERVEGTAATVAVGIMKGVDIVRVHDVKQMVRVARMTDAMVRR